MKITKNIFICALFVLMFLVCVNACNAEETLNETLGTNSIGNLSVDEVHLEMLSANEDTSVVDANGDGDYTTISDAVSHTDGGATIFIKNGENSESSTVTFTKSVNADNLVVNGDGNYELTAGDELEKNMPVIMENSQESIVLPEGTIYVSESGNDGNDGLSQESAIQTLSRAVDIVKVRENKTATVFMLNGEYTTGTIDIGDDVGVSLSIIGQEKGKVIIHGTGICVFDVYGDNLVWNFKNIDIVDVDGTGTSAALVLYSTNGNFTITDCNFKNINAKFGAMALGNRNGNVDVTNCLIENITGSVAAQSSVICINDKNTVNFDNIVIRNCRINESLAAETPATYLRSVFYVNNNYANVTLSNSEIRNCSGPMYSIIESKSKLTIINATIIDNIVNSSLNGVNGGECLFWASNDYADINISNCVITNNTIVKSTKGLFYNQKGSINVEYCVIVNNTVNSFIGSTGSIVADNNWWGTNDQPDGKVDKWVIMNVETDDSNLTENNEITFTIDFNHVKTSSGDIEDLTGGNIPQNSYAIALTAKEGEITPTNVVVNKNQVKSQIFKVTEINDEITLSCDGDEVKVTLEGILPYMGIIYVNKTGNNDNNGSIDYPVADLATAIELANKGSGQIIINEGTYAGYAYHITRDLNITGVGKVTLDGEGGGQLFYTGYTTDISQIVLNNLTLSGASDSYGQAINSYADELILSNINITDNQGTGSLISQNGKLSMDNCIIANHNGGNVIADSSSGQIVINNTLFENNTVTDYAIVYLSSSSGNLIVENTRFINNTAKLGILKSSKKTTVINSKFINNTNTNGYGGAISDCDALTVLNSIFINNKAAKDGGAINIGYNRVATITKSTFINNTANTDKSSYQGDVIYNKGKLTINYCILLTNAENSYIYSESEYSTNAQYNWWGTNDDPCELNGVGTYEDDDYDEVDCEIDSSNWVYMNVVADLTDICVGDKVEITVDFTNYIDSTNSLNPLSDSIPEVNVSANAVYGVLDSRQIITSTTANFVYTAKDAGNDTITISSTNAIVPIAIKVNESDEEIIYVDGDNGNNSNDGKTRQTAVKTIDYAIGIAKNKIIILTGEYTVTSLLNITKDLDIAGEGDVTIKSNAATSITYEEWDDWEEEFVTQTKTIYSLIENNANLNLTNIKFTLVPASISDSLILNNVNLYVNACEFTAIKVTSSKGVIQNIRGATLKVNGTTFTSSSSTYGAINNNGELLVNNSKFLNTDRSGEGGVYSTSITSYNQATIINTEFKNNKGSSGGAVYVMYSYTLKENPVMTIDNCNFESNAASGTYGDGAAIKCSGNQVTLNVTNSTFYKNTATRNGGAIYAQGTVNINQCIFIDNDADSAKTLYAYSGNINISNSIILENGNAISRYESSYSDPATVTANDNWWGTNDEPVNIGDGITVDKWAMMDATYTPDSAQPGSEVIITATLDNVKLPDGIIKVTFASTSGNLNEDVIIKNAKANVTYTIDDADEYITVNSSEAQVIMPIAGSSADKIYVSPSGNDENNGLTPKNAVATIKYAYSIVNEGGTIYLLNGKHMCNEENSDYDIQGLVFTKSVSFVGENVEKTIIDFAKEGYFLLSGGDVDFIRFDNITFLNGHLTESIFSLNGGNLNELMIAGCKFINCTALKGEIYSELNSISIVLHGNYFELQKPTAVYIGGGSADIQAQYNIFDGDSAKTTNPITGNDQTTGNMDYNYFATNDKPAEGAVPFTYWVIANVSANPNTEVYEGDEITITVEFNQYSDGTTNFTQINLIPDYLNVTFVAGNGNITKDSVKIENGIASTCYSSDAEGKDVVIIKPTSLSVEINVLSPDIYVLPGASDSNPGTRDLPVGTIEHALEIAAKGRIILLEGTHKTGYLGIISDDLTIVGEGKVTIDAQNDDKILSVGENANVLIKNVIMINGYTSEDSGALIINGNNLTLINCTLANSSASDNNGGAIFNAGDLTIINTTFSNNMAKEGGAIFTQISKETHSVNIINSTFENNVATGNDALGGGAIYIQRNSGLYNLDLIIDNSTFANNKAAGDSCGGAIALVQLDANVKITGSKFISNHANGQERFGGGVIYTTGISNTQKSGNIEITGTLFENNTCGANGGVIYARATSVSISNSALINNSDSNGLTIYGYKTDTVTPTITLNDNWWGSNDSPKGLVGGNSNYKPTLNRWAILTVTNDSEIIEGNAVKLTVAITDYTTGTENGTLSNPICVSRDAVITTTFDNIEGVLENGEFCYDLTVPANLKYISATVDCETIVLFVVPTEVIVEIDDVVAKQFEVVNISINVTTTDGLNVDCGNVELYVGDDLISAIPVLNGKAEKEITVSYGEDTYELVAKFVDDSGLYIENESDATLTVSGIIDLRNETFYNFFDENGILKDEINQDELIFHGDFSNLGVNVITVNKPLTIRGDGARLYGIAFRLTSDDVILTNISLTADGSDFTGNDFAAIYANGVNIVLDNVSVEYNSPSDKEAYAIYIDTGDEFKLLNSEIIFVGNNKDYTNLIHQYGVHIATSNDVLIYNNIFIASLPALDIAYNYMNPDLNGIYQDLVAIIAVQDGSNINITKNRINVSTDGGYGSYPTISSVLVNGVEDLWIDYNNITHIDLTSEDVARYYYTVDLYSSDVIVEFNNILLNTTSGIDRSGTAYPIQLTGPINALINKNNLTSISKGPNLGIFSADWAGNVAVTITDNLFNITGYSTEHKNALVSGMELQTEFAYVYNNTIYVHNIGDYYDANSIYGISYAQWYYGDHSFDIRENTIFSEGKYAIFILNAFDSDVTDNILYAHELYGDSSVNISSGNGNIVENNFPVDVIANVLVNPVDYGDDVIVNVTGSVAGDYTVAVNGIVKNVKINAPGEFVSVDFGVLPVNTEGYKITANYNNTLRYIGIVNDTELAIVNKAKSTINVVCQPVVYGDNVIVNVTGSVSGDYAVTINNVTKDFRVDVAGETLSVDFGTLTVGSYDVIAYYSGNDNYTNGSAKAIVKVNRAVPVICVSADSIAYGDVLVVNVGLPGDVSRRATVSIGNDTKAVSLVDGMGTVKFTGLAAGTYTVVASYNGDGNYLKASVNASVKVNRAVPVICVSADSIAYGEDLVVNVALPSDVARRATVIVDGNSSKAVILKDGVGSVKFNGLAVGTHTITVSYNGDGNYAKASVTTTVKVTRGPAAIDVVANPVSYGEPAIVEIQLPSDVTRRAVVVIDNNITKTVSLKNGSASVAFNNLAVGTHDITVSYNGDSKYLKSSVNTTVKVDRATPEIQVTANNITEGETLTVNVQLPSDATRRATVTIDGVSKAVNLKSGVGSVKFTGLTAGSHEVVVSYGGDTNYKKASTTQTIVVEN